MVMVIIKSVILEMLSMMTKHNNPLWDKNMDVIYKKIALKLIVVILVSLMIRIGLQINKIIRCITTSEYKLKICKSASCLSYCQTFRKVI